jgi:hypothetical protein
VFLPGPRAPDTTIDFEQYAPGTAITNQYADAGGTGQGVVFGLLPGGGGSTIVPVIESAPGDAQSGSQVANLSTCTGCEFFTPSTSGTFTVPRSHVSVYVGYLGAPAVCPAGNPNEACAFVTLLAFDSNGAQVASSGQVRVVQGQGVHTQLSVSTAKAEIVGFEITAREADDADKHIAIDDLAFDNPSGSSSADFTLTPASSVVKVVQGASATDVITIGRLGGSTGDIQLDATGLPTGVHAQFVPDPAGGTTSTLTLTADPNAPESVGTYATVTVTGTPVDKSAGKNTHSFTLSVGVAPAFGLSIEGSTNVSLSSCSATLAVDVTRAASFPGPVSLSVTGLPGGVQASFAPAQATFPNGVALQTVTLTLTAPPSGMRLLRRTATIHGTAPPYAEHTATFTVGGLCPRQFDAQITSLQITQGTQLAFLPTRDPDYPTAPIPYSTIEAAAQSGTRQAAAHFHAGRWTVVRVYADLRFGPADGIAVPMVLRGYRFNGLGQLVELSGSPILPVFSPPVLVPGPDQPTLADEGSDRAAYEFSLPSSWTHGKLEVVATLMPAQSGPPQAIAARKNRGTVTHGVLPQPPVFAPCETAECVQNDSMGMRDIPFHDSAPIRIRPLALVVDGQPLPDPATAFRWARMESPLSLQIEPYATTIDVSDLVGKSAGSALGTMNDRVGSYVCDNDMPPGYPVAGWIIGVAGNGILRGGSNVVATWCWGFPSSGTYRYAVVDSDAPAYSVPHELFHLLGRGHASAACGGADNDTFLNLGLAINNHEGWPPDEAGYFQSVGLAHEHFSGANPYHVLFGPPPGGGRTNCRSGTPPCPDPATDWFDIMSYCGNRNFLGDPLIDGVWVSVHNWNAVFDAYTVGRVHLQPGPTRGVRGGTPVASLYLNALLAPDGTVTITSVAPVATAPETEPASDYHLVGLDSSGHAVADAPLVETSAHADGEPERQTLAGVIPAVGVASVSVVKQGVTLATRGLSAHAPTATLDGVPSISGGTAHIRFSASDADGDPLQVALSYSSDGGRTWRVVWIGPNRGDVTLPARYLSKANAARVRIEVNDGFQSTVAVSPQFKSPGAPPLTAIVLPSPGLSQPADAPLVLSGQAYDDSSEPLAGKHLRWMLGKRLLGTGEQITVAGLPAGTQRIELLARDSAGRVGHASIAVRLTAVAPLFVKLSAPRSLARTAGSLRLTVASSVPATLTIRIAGMGAQTFRVDRTVRRITVRVPHGRKPLSLRLSLSASGLTRTEVLSLRRR